jgi:hypothetical protein
MQAPSQAESEKPSSLVISPHPWRWLCPWFPKDHDIHRIHEVQLGYQRQLVRLMFAVRSLPLWEGFTTSLAKIADIRVVWLFGHFLPF